MIVFGMIFGLTGLEAGWKQYLFYAVGGGLGGWIGHKFEKPIEMAGTAVIGSYFLVFGIGSYAGGFPDPSNIKERLTDPKANLEVVGYTVGFVVVAIAGYVFQYKKFRETFDGQDNYMKM